MQDNKVELKSTKAWRILRFLISGGIGALTNIGILYLLTDTYHFWYLFSSALSVMASLFVSFVLQKFFTFKNFEKGKTNKQIFSFVAVSLISLILNTILMYSLVSVLGVHYVFGQIICSIILAISSYIFYGRVVFNKVVV